MQPTKLSVIEGAIRFYTTGKIHLAEKVIITLLLLGYILFPIDLIPDVIPVIGWLDDIGVSCLALAYFNHRVNAVMSEDAPPQQEPEPVNAEILTEDKSLFTPKKK